MTFDIESINIKTVDLQHESDEIATILLYQPHWILDDWSTKSGLFFLQNQDKVNNLIKKSLDISEAYKASVLILPELSVPEASISIIKEWSKSNSTIVIAGSHYFNTKNGYINRTPIVSNGIIYYSEKLIPSPLEVSPFPSDSLNAGTNILVFKNSKIGDFVVLICADYLESRIKNKIISKYALDFLFIPAFHSSSSRYHDTMKVDMQSSTKGLYIVYSNNSLQNSGDGHSAFFGNMDSIFYKKLIGKTTDGKPTTKLIEFSSENEYAIIKADVKCKRPLLGKTIHTTPNVNIIYHDIVNTTEVETPSLQLNKDTENRGETEGNSKRIEYLSQQSQSILNTTLLPWLPSGVGGFRVLWPDLLISGPIFETKKQIYSDLKTWLTESAPLSNTVIIGSPGIGKSIALKFIFMTLKERYENTKSTFPLYIHCLDLANNVSKFLNILSSLSDQNSKLTVLIDGLDEVEIEKGENLIQVILPKIQTYGSWILASREVHFYTNVLHIPGFDTSITHVLELKDWDVEQHSLRFSKKYFDAINATNDYEGLKEIILKEDIKKFITNPFHLTLLIFLYRSQVLSEIKLSNKFSLYSLFYKNWIEREAVRKLKKPNLIKEIITIHETLAIESYQNREKTFSDIIENLNISEEILQQPAFKDLFIERFSFLTLETEYAGFRHESLFEFLLAKKIIRELLNLSNENIPQILSEEFSQDINSFIRSGFSVLSKQDKFSINLKMSKCYTFLLNIRLKQPIGMSYLDINSTTKQKNELKTRSFFKVSEQLIYYLGRLECKGSIAIILYAYKTDPNPIIHRAAALGAILNGNKEIEKEYINSLLSDPEQNLINRSIQLVYFGDTMESIFSFRDDSSISWERTYHGTLSRLNEQGLRGHQLRWWDLCTIYSFIISRQKNNNNVVNNLLRITLKKLLIEPNHQNLDRDKAIKKLAQKILLLIK